MKLKLDMNKAQDRLIAAVAIVMGTFAALYLTAWLLYLFPMLFFGIMALAFIGTIVFLVYWILKPY